MYRKLLQSICILRKYLFYGVLLQVFSVTVVFAQSQTISGKVTSSEDNVPLPGTSIVVKGTTVGTVTDGEGTFKLEVPSSDAVLVFSSIGYASQEVLVGGRTSFDVALSMDVTQLSEIVVVGYGTVKKSDVTGALSRVTSETIMERPVQNAVQALQGKVAGMNVASNMKPGETPSVNIRGNRSFGTSGASNDPLYVVDGVPLITVLGVSSFTINDINPNDISSIEVLKDASATAIYGSRGANGVILVTTKKGTKGKVNVNYNTSVSLDSYHSMSDWMNAGQFVDQWRLGLMNGRMYQPTTNTNMNQPADIWYPDPAIDKAKMAGITSDPLALAGIMQAYEFEDDGITPKTRATTAEEQALGWPAEVPIYNSDNIKSYDWRKEALRQGVTQNHQLSLSSGTETSRLYLSLGYLNQKGVQRDQDFERFTTNISGDITANKWLTIGTSILGSFSLQNFGVNANLGNTGAKDLFSRASEMYPYAPQKDANGAWIRNPGGNINLWNPLIDIDQSINERRTASVLTNVFGEIKFAPWLKYRLNVGAQYRNFRRGAWTGPTATSHLNGKPNTAGYNTEENFSWVAENLLFFDKTIADVHTVGVTLLQSTQKSRRENVNANVSGSVYDISQWYDLGANTIGRPDGYGSGFTANTLMSYMARVNYAYNNKYLLTASGRYDGASVLAPDHKWSFFPSFALAWKMHDEGFMSNFSWIDEFKPRLGYGVTGNSSVDPYSTSGPLSRNPYVFTSATGIAVPAIGYLPQLVKNPLLGWEKSAQVNVGADFSFLKGRISGALEFYQTTTSDLILRKTLPGVSGYAEKLENIGKTRNKGIEITLSTVNIEKGDFTWSMDMNFAANREEIVELINGKEDMLAQRWFIGQQLQVFYHYQDDGIWQNTEEDLAEMAKFNAASGGAHKFFPGTIKIVDQLTVDTDGDGVNDAGDYKINASDYVIRGSGRPKWSGGITNTFSYKNWSLSSFIYARIGQTYFGGTPAYAGAATSGRVETDVWSWDNPGGKWQMPNLGSVDNFTAANQFHDGSFAVVRNIALAYTLPKELLGKISVKDVRLTFQVLNPFMFGGEVVKEGINPDDVTNWSDVSQPNTNVSNPLGGVNNNTILQQSFVFGLNASF